MPGREFCSRICTILQACEHALRLNNPVYCDRINRLFELELYYAWLLDRAKQTTPIENDTKHSTMDSEPIMK